MNKYVYVESYICMGGWMDGCTSTCIIVMFTYTVCVLYIYVPYVWQIITASASGNGTNSGNKVQAKAQKQKYVLHTRNTVNVNACAFFSLPQSEQES